jgi:1,4-dihydroxy-2-naphthoate octaprenyltransferase
MNRLQVWILASRPKTLWAALVPVVIGGVLAASDDLFHATSFALALAGALAIQVGTNLFNDYADFVKGADTEHRKGPLRVTQAGLLRPGSVLAGAIVTFIVATACGIYLIWRGGWPILAIGAASIVCGILYTAGPRPLGYVGLADLFVLLFFGPIAVAGTYWVQALTMNRLVIVAGLAPGLLSVALLTINNLRDIDEDAVVGKRTLAVRFGSRFARWEYVVTLTLGLAVPAMLYAMSGQHAWSMLCLLIIPLALPDIRSVLGGRAGKALNALLGSTARLSLLYSLVFSVTWML